MEVSWLSPVTVSSANKSLIQKRLGTCERASVMFDILFGWRKASKCKRLIRRVQCRLKLLKNKRYSIVRKLREDVAQLIKTGYEEIAIDRADQLFKDKCIMEVFELLDHFCEFILINISYIRQHRDCPNDINEAVSSLIFASARCGDLPELRAIRKLFGERYGDSFAKGALELCPGNLVNYEIRDKLSIKSVSEDVKQRLVDEISRDYCLQPEVLALEYASELQKQMKETMEMHVLDATAQLIPYRIKKSKLQVLDPEGVDTKSVLVDPTGISDELVKAPVISSLGSNGSGNTDTLQGASECKKNLDVISSSSSFSRNSPQFYQEKVVYLDDVEEVHTSLNKNMSSQDQRLFKFKSSPVPRGEAHEEGYLEEGDPWEVQVSEDLRKSKTGPDKRMRRSLSVDSQCWASPEFATYYASLKKNSNHKGKPSKQRNKHHKKDTVHASNQFSSSEKRLEQPAQHPVKVCRKVKHCSLESPCYSHVLPEQTVNELKSTSLPTKQESICNENLAVLYYAFTYEGSKPSKRSSKMVQKRESSASEMGSLSSGEDDQSLPLPPYLRAMTMPPECSKEVQPEKTLRSNSSPFQHQNHVHPKLPDYDVIATKFSALKEKHLQRKDQCKKQEVH